MAKTKRRRRAQRNRYLALLLIGSGLVISALVLTLILIRRDAVANETSGNFVVPATVSFPAPEISLTDLDGNAVSLADYHGQVVLVNNWATWCPPCRAEMPILDAFHDEHASQGFSIIAVDAGEPAADVRRFAESMELSFPVWLDPEMTAIRAFRNDGLPSSYVVDADGKVVLAWNGAISREMLEQYVTPLLEN
jgi:thiol-disulfide isomerase/thioredoxin